MGSATGSPPGVPAARHRNFWEKTAPVAVKIKLKRLGKIRAPYYRIVVADARTKRDGRAIEEIGKYHPKAEPSFIEVNSERAQHWLSVGAQPTDPVRKILEITGDWQKFKGLPGAEGTLKMAAPKEDRKEIFAAAVKENMGAAAAAPKGRGKSAAAAKDSEPATEKAGKATSARAEKPARAKADEQPAKAKSGAATEDAKDKAADAKGEDGTAKASTAKDGAAKDGAAKDKAADAKGEDSAAKASTAKDSAAKDGAAKDGAAKDGAAKDGAANGTSSAESAPTGSSADSAKNGSSSTESKGSKTGTSSGGDKKSSSVTTAAS
jgi:small subunit ribosomal protein S16